MKYIESQYFKEVQRLVGEKRCLWCKKKFDEGWLIPTGKSFPNNIVINSEIAFHWQDSHGFPCEILVDMVNEKIGFKNYKI